MKETSELGTLDGRLIVIASNLPSMKSRIASHNILSGRIGGPRHIIMCKRVPPGWAQEFSNLEFVRPPKPKRGLFFFWWAARASARYRSEGSKYLEIGSGYSLTILRLIFGVCKESLIFLALSPTVQVFKERGWRTDRFAAPLTFGHDLRLLFRWLKWACLEHFFASVVGNLIGNSEQVIAPHRAQRNDGFRVTVIPNCILPASETSATSGQECSKLRIIIACNVEPNKGLGTAFKVLSELRELEIPYECRHAGSSDNSSEKWFNRTLAKYSQSINFSRLGHQSTEDLGRTFANSDVLLLPTYYEGSPRVVLEALSQGCRIVASDIPGISMLREKMKDYVYTFAPSDFKTASKQIAQIALDNPVRSEISKAVQDSFSPEQRALELSRFLRTRWHPSL